MERVIASEAVIQDALGIRCVEESLLDQYRLGRIRGTIHTCIGQEYLPAALGILRIDGDMWFSNHRGHGHYLASGHTSQSLIDEILGRETGVSFGIGGSQHLFGEGFISNGVQGGLAPIAAGYAFAQKERDDGSMSCIFVGDGTLGQGQFWEAMNLSALLGGPLLILIEDNGIAQSSLSSNALAGDISLRVRGFGHDYTFVDGQDIDQLCAILPDIVSKVRRDRRPHVLHVRSARLGAHSKGDDNRSAEMLSALRKRDPIELRMTSDPTFITKHQDLQVAAHEQCEQAVTKQESRHTPEDLARNLVSVGNGPAFHDQYARDAAMVVDSRKLVDVLYDSIAQALEEHEHSIFIGEDIEYHSEGTDRPYGGAFKVSRNLSERFPGRVLNTPISEAGITGFALGHALAGQPAIVEIMFGDFITQTIDQIVQQASKIPTMFGQSVRLPLLLRTPMGGGLGYGATHSQSLERLVLGLPNLLVLAVSAFPTSVDMYSALLKIALPAIVLEEKLAYRAKPPEIGSPFLLEIDSAAELPISMRCRTIRSPEAESQVTVVTYGGTTRACLLAQRDLLEKHGVLIEVIEFTLISPLRTKELVSSLDRTSRLLVVEQGMTSFGFGSEVLARCTEAGSKIDKFARLGCEGIIPANKVGEDFQTVGADDVVDKILSMLGAVDGFE